MDESVIRHLEQPKVGTLKLSEAIRIGARMRPQCRGTFFREGGSCALGAAVEAKEGHPTLNFDQNWESYFGAPMKIMEEVTWMNDRSNFSREQIADWLEAQGY